MMMRQMSLCFCRWFTPPEVLSPSALGSPFRVLFRWQSDRSKKSGARNETHLPTQRPSASKASSSEPSSSNRSAFSDFIVDFQSPEHRLRVNQLSEFFPKRDIEAMAAVCPNIFFRDWSEVTNIVQYISTKMGLNQEDMISAEVFNYPLEHIVKRHVFVERCGLFTKVNEKKREAELETNMSLNAIVRSPNSQLVKFAGVTQEEYEVFCDMFSMQKHKLLDYILEAKLPLSLDENDPDEVAEEEEPEKETHGYFRERKKRAKERGVPVRE